MRFASCCSTLALADLHWSHPLLTYLLAHVTPPPCSVYITLEHEYLGWLSAVGCTLNRDGDRVELVKAKTAARRVPSVLRFECPSEEEADKWQSSMRESIDAANELTEKDERRRSAAFNSSTNIAFTKESNQARASLSCLAPLPSSSALPSRFKLHPSLRSPPLFTRWCFLPLRSPLPHPICLASLANFSRASHTNFPLEAKTSI